MSWEPRLWNILLPLPCNYNHWGWALDYLRPSVGLCHFQLRRWRNQGGAARAVLPAAVGTRVPDKDLHSMSVITCNTLQYPLFTIVSLMQHFTRCPSKSPLKSMVVQAACTCYGWVK